MAPEIDEKSLREKIISPELMEELMLLDSSKQETNEVAAARIWKKLHKPSRKKSLFIIPVTILAAAALLLVFFPLKNNDQSDGLKGQLPLQVITQLNSGFVLQNVKSAGDHLEISYTSEIAIEAFVFSEDHEKIGTFMAQKGENQKIILNYSLKDKKVNVCVMLGIPATKNLPKSVYTCQKPS